MPTPIRRVRWYLSLDRNPLRRASDRVESVATVGLLVTLLWLAPVLTWNVGHAVYASGVADERADESRRLRTVAVLTEATAASKGRSPIRAPHVPRANATWTGPDGTVHTGRIPVPFGTSADLGATVPVWLDPRTGRAVEPPRDHGQTVAQTVAGALGVPLVLMLVVFGLHRALRRGLDRRRLAQWQTAWVLVEPGWSRRRY
jgi:hypothetical protein